MQGKIYIVATPIGNKDDITIRAISTLKDVDIIAAEDTRVASKLLTLLNIPKKQLVSINEFATDANIKKIIDLIFEGKNVAYISDAGSPGISDPGAVLVKMCRENDVEIIPIPGASAITTLMSVAGIRETPFMFYGFLPHKKGRQKILGELMNNDTNIILYESVHRFIKLLEEVNKINPNQQLIIGRELTKLYEEIKADTVENILDFYNQNPTKVKGEFVIIIKK